MNIFRHITIFCLLLSVQLHAHFLEDHLEKTSAYWGVCMIDRHTGESLCEINSKKLFIPASVTKLVTSAAALNQFGPEFRFKTRVYSLCPHSKAGILAGDIYLHGSGDPSLHKDGLKYLAKQLYKKGVRRIEGQVLLSGEQSELFAPHIEWEDFSESYAPEVTPLSLDDNCIVVNLTPTQPNEPIQISIAQEIPYITMLNLVTTDSEISAIQIRRGLTDNHFILKGTLSKARELKVPLHRPDEYARLLFIKYLSEEGIEIIGKDLSNEPHILPYYELASIESPRLMLLLNKLNKYSHNLTGEQLHRLLPSGELNHFLEREQLHVAGHLHDGSGLSRHNMLTPHEVVKLLEWLDHSPYQKEFLNTLSVAGVEGSLAKRFRNTHLEGRLMGKTGSVENVSTLGGYAKTSSGREVIFCVMLNFGPLVGCIEEMDAVVLKLFENY